MFMGLLIQFIFQNCHPSYWMIICFLVIMGCASSKQKRCRHCNHPYSPVPRSYSMHVHQQPPPPPRTKGENHHVVALTSTTLGTLKLNSPASNHWQPKNVSDGTDVDADEYRFFYGKIANDSFRFGNDNIFSNETEKKKKAGISSSESERREEFSVGLIEAKTWSNMIEQKLHKATPKTPTITPPGEPETVINTWELMEGLEDTSPFRSPNHIRSFSFDVSGPDFNVTTTTITTSPQRKPMWLHMTEEEARLNPVIADFDPEVISAFKKSLQQISPDSPFHLRPAAMPEDELQGTIGRGELSPEQKKTKDDHHVVDVKLVSNGKEKVVCYFTSLRGVRKTYEQCCKVMLILKGLGLRVDERDVSMHSGFKEELKDLLGDDYGKGGFPKVFIGRNYIGGAEEIQKLHEDGKLEKMLDCCENVEDCGGEGGDVCEACGDIRFVPCETCSGSCKIYQEFNEEEADQEEDGDYGFQRCPDCNENGLVRCPVCCY